MRESETLERLFKEFQKSFIFQQRKNKQKLNLFIDKIAFFFGLQLLRIIENLSWLIKNTFQFCIGFYIHYTLQDSVQMNIFLIGPLVWLLLSFFIIDQTILRNSFLVLMVPMFCGREVIYIYAARKVFTDTYSDLLLGIGMCYFIDLNLTINQKRIKTDLFKFLQ